MLEATPFMQTMNAITTWIFAGSSLSAVVGGVWAVYRYSSERRRDREQRVAELEQRESEHRWRCAQAGKGLLDDLFSDPKASVALHMLDSWSRTYDLPNGVTAVIAAEDWLRALRSAADVAADPKGILVRDSFDAMFERMAMMEHYIANGFVRLIDVAFPLSYYVAILAEDKAIHDAYLKYFRFHNALAFLARFPEWTSPSGEVVQSRVEPPS